MRAIHTRSRQNNPHRAKFKISPDKSSPAGSNLAYLEQGTSDPTLQGQASALAALDRFIAWDYTSEGLYGFAFSNNQEIPEASWVSKRLYLGFLDWQLLKARKGTAASSTPYKAGTILEYGRKILNIGKRRVEAAYSDLGQAVPSQHAEFFKVLLPGPSWYKTAETLVHRAVVQELRAAHEVPLTESDKTPLALADLVRIHLALARDGKNDRFFCVDNVAATNFSCCAYQLSTMYHVQPRKVGVFAAYV